MAFDFPVPSATASKGRAWRERPIVVCEPARFVRKLMIDILRNAGAERVAAADTPGAARYLLTQAADPLLVAGWRRDSAAGEGPDLVRAVRRMPGLASAPSLIVTSRNAFGDILRARDCGADAVALSPASPRVILDRLEAITERPRPFIRAARYVGPDRRRDRPMRGAFKRDADVAAGLVSAQRAAQNEAQAVIFDSLRRGDPLAARVGRSLERFFAHSRKLGLEAVEIVDLHRYALARLGDLQDNSMEERIEVVIGLERVGDRFTA